MNHNESNINNNDLGLINENSNNNIINSLYIPVLRDSNNNISRRHFLYNPENQKNKIKNYKMSLNSNCLTDNKTNEEMLNFNKKTNSLYFSNANGKKRDAISPSNNVCKNNEIKFITDFKNHERNNSSVFSIINPEINPNVLSNYSKCKAKNLTKDKAQPESVVLSNNILEKDKEMKVDKFSITHDRNNESNNHHKTFIKSKSFRIIDTQEKNISKIFYYKIFDCFQRKDKYFYKLQALIRKDLSIENILNIVNTHEIIKNFLNDSEIISLSDKIDFFEKLNKFQSSRKPPESFSKALPAKSKDNDIS